MSETYTQAELDDLSRAELRRLATHVYGMDNRKCINAPSDEIKEYILKKQDGGGKAETGGKRGKTSKAGKAGKKATSKSGNGKGKSQEKETEAAPASADSGDLAPLIDALGKTLDEHAELTEKMFKEIEDSLIDLDKSAYITNGLLMDIYRYHFEPEDLDSRLKELEEEYESEGNEDGE